MTSPDLKIYQADKSNLIGQQVAKPKEIGMKSAQRDSVFEASVFLTESKLVKN
jgi:hypothetical protein